MRYLLLLFLSFGHILGYGQKNQNLDTSILDAPFQAGKSVERLSAYINQQAQNDRERVWAYYLWLSHNIAYDTRTFFSNNPNPRIKPEEVLKSKKAICQGYADLFTALCQLNNIPCFTVPGYSKGYGYNAKKKFTKSDHAWNAVFVEGKWYLLDATWGAGYVDEQKKYHQQFSDEYFLSSPDEFILKHLPQDPMWQLLTCPLSMDLFKRTDEEIRVAISSNKNCFNFNDTIQAYRKLSPVEQQVDAAERAFRYNPKNYAAPGYAYLSLAYDLAQDLPELYDQKAYPKALLLNKQVLHYNEKAYAYLKKSRESSVSAARDIARQNIAQMKANISSLEKFLK